MSKAVAFSTLFTSIFGYELVNEPVKFVDANQKCQDLYGSSLASIHSHSDYILAQATCQSGPCWIGGVHGEVHDDGTFTKNTNFNTDPSWNWLDGTEWDYEHWGAFNSVPQGQGITGEYYTCIYHVWDRDNTPGINDCGDNEEFRPVCNAANCNKLQLEQDGYNEVNATWIFNGGCQEHFSSLIYQNKIGDLSLIQCNALCEDRNNCKSFLFGKRGISRQNWCNLYSLVCTDNGDKDWNAFIPETNIAVLQEGNVNAICSGSSNCNEQQLENDGYNEVFAEWIFNGGCHEHFSSLIYQDKLGGLSLIQCDALCQERSDCKSYLFGKRGISRENWCNLYDVVCTDNGDQDWNAFTPVLPRSNIDAICDGPSDSTLSPSETPIAAILTPTTAPSTGIALQSTNAQSTTPSPVEIATLRSSVNRICYDAMLYVVFTAIYIAYY